MFKELFELVRACGPLTMAVSADAPRGTMTVVVIPKPADAKDEPALATPLSLTATPEEFDAEFTTVLAGYRTQRLSLAEQVAATNEVLAAAREASVQKGSKGHDVVARQQPGRARDAEGQVVGAMAGRRDHLQRHAAGGDALALAQDPIGHQLPVAVGSNGIELEQTLLPARPMPAAEPDRGARRLAQPPHQRRVIAMGVGEDDSLDLPAADRLLQRREMAQIVRPRVNHEDRPITDDEAVGALEGIGPGIWGRDANDRRSNRYRPSRFGHEIGVERDWRMGSHHCAPYVERLVIQPSAMPLFAKDWQWP